MIQQWEDTFIPFLLYWHWNTEKHWKAKQQSGEQLRVTEQSRQQVTTRNTWITCWHESERPPSPSGCWRRSRSAARTRSEKRGGLNSLRTRGQREHGGVPWNWILHELKDRNTLPVGQKWELPSETTWFKLWKINYHIWKLSNNQPFSKFFTR